MLSVGILLKKTGMLCKAQLIGGWTSAIVQVLLSNTHWPLQDSSCAAVRGIDLWESAQDRRTKSKEVPVTSDRVRRP